MKQGKNYMNYPGVVNLLVGSYQNTDRLIETIFNYVVTDTGISKADILGSSRLKKIKEARQLFHYLAHDLTEDTLQSIGSYTNNHHCTTIHSIKTVDNVMTYDKKLVIKVSNLKEAINLSLSKNQLISDIIN